MNKEKAFVYFMLFITIVVIPMALFYLMLTGRMNNLSPKIIGAIKIYLAMVCGLLLLMIVNRFIKI
jgi:hypothetical protein